MTLMNLMNDEYLYLMSTASYPSSKLVILFVCLVLTTPCILSNPHPLLFIYFLAFHHHRSIASDGG